MTSNKQVITLSAPHNFEGTEYKEIDLSNIENLTTEDILEADKEFAAAGQFAMMNEMATGYSLILAARATKLPVELFKSLKAKDGLKVKRQVMNFLNN